MIFFKIITYQFIIYYIIIYIIIHVIIIITITITINHSFSIQLGILNRQFTFSTYPIIIKISRINLQLYFIIIKQLFMIIFRYTLQYCFSISL